MLSLAPVVTALTFPQQLIVTVVDKLIIGTAVLFVGYCVTKAVERFKNDQARQREFDVLRDKEALRHLQRQIEELYSPLLGLIRYSVNVFSVFDQKKRNLAPQDRIDLERYFTEKHFLKMNEQMAELIRSKVYLVATPDVPESFHHFLEHEATFRDPI